jgi:hypothetical protein
MSRSIELYKSQFYFRIISLFLEVNRCPYKTRYQYLTGSLYLATLQSSVGALVVVTDTWSLDGSSSSGIDYCFFFQFTAN